MQDIHKINKSFMDGLGITDTDDITSVTIHITPDNLPEIIINRIMIETALEFSDTYELKLKE